jgi:ankyrin repeat protein
LVCEDPEYVQILRLLLERFPDYDTPIIPVLFHAVGAENFEGVHLILSMRPPGHVNIQDLTGSTALFFTESAEMLKLLLELGADPRIADMDGGTRLMFASDADRARMLLEAAPDLVGMRDNKGRTALMHLSCNDDQYEELEVLLRYCNEHGLDAGVNNKDINGDTALQLAMVQCHFPTVLLLLKNGADVISSDDQDHATTVLMQPLMDPAILSSMYDDLAIPDPRRFAAKDRKVRDCLRVLLNTVLLHSGNRVVHADAGAGGGTDTSESASKRRRTN